ncbi:MAG TPA: pantoate--beta-alanine ligase [Anaeromyxobacteraceae bacterium]|nr:pantoate--beta-alanine ligase [Anaeromyxobacteraceae bacterium]
MQSPELIRDPAEWQRRCTAARDAGRRIALVPTMGYLHEGHLSLLREARRRADEGGAPGLALATVFVNPAQFGPSEDLARYPRDLEGDLAKCASAGVDWVLAPESPDRMYPAGYQTWVEVTEVSKGLCGERRPGHFRGVATVVAKLFGLSRPHVALFGEKDYQQLQVIRAMVRDLGMGVEVAGMAIVREPDGLALSSRNAYLSPEERRRAVAVSRSLEEARRRAATGERDARALASKASREIAAAGLVPDYVEVVHPETLRLVERAEHGSRMLAAAFAGKTRLIDNVALP